MYLKLDDVELIIILGKSVQDNSNISVTDANYHERYKERNRDKLNLILKSIDNPNDNKVLDIGCNAGFYSTELAKLGAIVTGIDVDKGLIDKAKQVNINNLEFFVSDIESWDFDSNKYNFTLFLSVYHHLINLKGLDKARELLKKISDSSELLYFESGQRNEQVDYSWKNKLPENFSTPEDVFAELELVTTYEKFYLIGKLPIHGGERYLFLCSR